MTDDIAKETSALLAVAKQVVKREFGKDFVTSHPEVVASVFQGVASIEQTMEQLGKDICAAAAHARGE